MARGIATLYTCPISGHRTQKVKSGSLCLKVQYKAITSPAFPKDFMMLLKEPRFVANNNHRAGEALFGSVQGNSLHGLRYSSVVRIHSDDAWEKQISTENTQLYCVPWKAILLLCCGTARASP